MSNNEIQNPMPTWSTVIPEGTTHLWEGNPYKVQERVWRWCAIDGWVLSNVSEELVRNRMEFKPLNPERLGRHTPRRFQPKKNTVKKTVMRRYLRRVKK